MHLLIKPQCNIQLKLIFTSVCICKGLWKWEYEILSDCVTPLLQQHWRTHDNRGSRHFITCSEGRYYKYYESDLPCCSWISTYTTSPYCTWLTRSCPPGIRWSRTALWPVSKCGQMTSGWRGWRRWRPLTGPLRRLVWWTAQVRFRRVNWPMSLLMEQARKASSEETVQLLGFLSVCVLCRCVGHQAGGDGWSQGASHSDASCLCGDWENWRHTGRTISKQLDCG